jgi:hypothetical protein
MADLVAVESRTSKKINSETGKMPVPQITRFSSVCFLRTQCSHTAVIHHWKTTGHCIT